MPDLDELLNEYPAAQPSEGQLENIRRLATLARQFEKDITDLEERLSQTKRNLIRLTTETIPQAMDEAGIDRIGLPASGNLPAVDLTITPHYSANIWASWPPEKRKAAFDALTELGHGDLIKTEITTTFRRDQRDEALSLQRHLIDTYNLNPTLQESVHSKTLTAWLREQYERGNPLPPLDVIGAFIGRIAKFKERT
jgi:hypothetical protein